MLILFVRKFALPSIITKFLVAHAQLHSCSAILENCDSLDAAFLSFLWLCS